MRFGHAAESARSPHQPSLGCHRRSQFDDPVISSFGHNKVARWKCHNTLCIIER